MTRRDNVLEYFQEWRGGYWNLGEIHTADVPAKVADEVVAWEDINETPENLKAYADTFTELLEDGTLEYVVSGSGSLQLQIAER